MLRAVSEHDELKLFGATRLATIPQATTDLAARVGLAAIRDDDFAPGWGPFDVVCAETASGVMFTLATPLMAPASTAWVIAHALADLPAIAEALGLPMSALDTIAADPPKPWCVIRQDDNGNRAILNRCKDERTAQRAAAAWTARIGSHHQTIFIEAAPPRS